MFVGREDRKHGILSCHIFAIIVDLPTVYVCGDSRSHLKDNGELRDKHFLQELLCNSH